MKGIEYSFVLYMLVGLVIFVWIFPVAKTAAGEAVKRTAFFQAEDIASKINILQSAPETTHAFFRTLKGKCSIEINQMYVLYEVDEEKFKSDILQTNNVIEKKTITCDERRAKLICFVKKTGIVKIFEDDCGS